MKKKLLLLVPLAIIVLALIYSAFDLFDTDSPLQFNKKSDEIIKYGPAPNNFFGTVLPAPLLIILLCWIFEIRAMEFTEKIMPAFAVQYCLSNIANFFDGCCAGKYWENGMFNIAAGEKQHRKSEFRQMPPAAGVCSEDLIIQSCCQNNKKYIRAASFRRSGSDFLLTTDKNNRKIKSAKRQKEICCEILF